MSCGAWARRAGLIACLLPIGWGLPAQAAQDPAKPELPKYEVSGFRDARFGMTEPEVRAAVAKAFGVKPADIKSNPNATEGTTLLLVRVDSQLWGGRCVLCATPRPRSAVWEMKNRTHATPNAAPR